MTQGKYPTLIRGYDLTWPDCFQGFWYFIRTCVLSVGLILALGFLLLVSLVNSAALTALERFWGGEEVVTVAGWLNVVFSFALVVVLFGTIYKVLPSVPPVGKTREHFSCIDPAHAAATGPLGPMAWVH